MIWINYGFMVTLFNVNITVFGWFCCAQDYDYLRLQNIWDSKKRLQNISHYLNLITLLNGENLKSLIGGYIVIYSIDKIVHGKKLYLQNCPNIFSNPSPYLSSNSKFIP